MTANTLYASNTKVCEGKVALLLLRDKPVLYQLVGEVMAHQGYDA